MNWTATKESFQNRLNLNRATILNAKTARRRSCRKLHTKFFDPNTDPVIQQYNLLLKQIEKSEQFLSNLEEMKDLCPALTETFLAEFLNSATLVIQNPESTEHYAKFCENLASFSSYAKTDLEINKNTAQKNAGFYFDGLVLSSFSLPASIIGIAVAASLGPVIAAISAVLFVVGLAAIVVCITQGVKNSRFVKDRQMNEIEEFVSGCKPAQAIGVQLPEASPKNDLTPQFGS